MGYVAVSEMFVAIDFRLAKKHINCKVDPLTCNSSPTFIIDYAFSAAVFITKCPHTGQSPYTMKPLI